MTGQHFRLIRKLQTFRPFKARKILLDNYTVNMVLEKSTGLVQIASLVEISTKLVEISTSISGNFHLVVGLLAWCTEHHYPCNKSSKIFPHLLEVLFRAC